MICGWNSRPNERDYEPLHNIERLGYDVLQTLTSRSNDIAALVIQDHSLAAQRRNPILPTKTNVGSRF
jgi:hypothetical protein